MLMIVYYSMNLLHAVEIFIFEVSVSHPMGNIWLLVPRIVKSGYVLFILRPLSCSSFLLPLLLPPPSFSPAHSFDRGQRKR